MTISLVNGVNPLQTTLFELGIVSGRVALLLRSAEIQPVFGRFVTEWHSPFTPQSQLGALCYRAGAGRGQGLPAPKSPAPKIPGCIYSPARYRGGRVNRATVADKYCGPLLPGGLT
jgi:hypothetical protein